MYDQKIGGHILCMKFGRTEAPAACAIIENEGCMKKDVPHGEYQRCARNMGMQTNHQIKAHTSAKRRARNSVWLIRFGWVHTRLMCQ
jgi:hypothetical protein